MTYKSIFRAVGVAVAVSFFGVSDAEAEKAKQIAVAKASISTFTDSRDKKTYKKVTIGTQTWMAENLNFEADGSKCYDNDADNCAKYGRLYDWETAKKACPSGWHLPSDAEWTTLADYVGGSLTAGTKGTKLKSKTGWNNDGNGTDFYGFSALPGGDGISDGSFGNAGYNGNWWSATEYDASNAWYRGMGCNEEYVYRYDYVKSYLYSVRCVQD